MMIGASGCVLSRHERGVSFCSSIPSFLRRIGDARVVSCKWGKAMRGLLGGGVVTASMAASFGSILNYLAPSALPPPLVEQSSQVKIHHPSLPPSLLLLLLLLSCNGSSALEICTKSALSVSLGCPPPNLLGKGRLSSVVCGRWREPQFSKRRSADFSSGPPHRTAYERKLPTNHRGEPGCPLQRVGEEDGGRKW
jgi:hypothetical protein